MVPLSDGLRRLRDGEELPPRAVAITFDDGYRDNLDLALPELERRGMAAAVFLVPGLLDRVVAPWWEQIAGALDAATAREILVEGRRFPLVTPGERRAARGPLAEMAKRRDQARRQEFVEGLLSQLAPRATPDPADLFLDWGGARELVARGVEIGSHSNGHAILAEETADAQRADLSSSRRALESGLGIVVSSLAYPNGTRRDYDDDTVAAAAHAGFDWALTTRKGLNGRRTPPYEVRRVVVYPERGSRLLRTAIQIAARRGARAVSQPGFRGLRRGVRRYDAA